MSPKAKILRDFEGEIKYFLNSRRRRENFEANYLPKWIFLQENRVWEMPGQAGARIFQREIHPGMYLASPWDVFGAHKFPLKKFWLRHLPKDDLLEGKSLLGEFALKKSCGVN